jgi:hypothetical protein
MNTNKQLSRCFLMLACLLACCLHSGCSKSGEAKTRAAQEEAFRNCFGFAPPASVTEIKYADYYQREVMDGAYEQWLICTFQVDVFDQMVKKRNYQRGRSSTLISSSQKPAWWTQDNTGGHIAYGRAGKDGTSYLAQLWHDEKTGLVYWHQQETD